MPELINIHASENKNDSSSTSISTNINNNSGELNDALADIKRIAQNIKSSTTPGVINRLQYAGFLFMGMLTCLLFKGVAGQAFADIPYLQEGCALITIGLHNVTTLPQQCYSDTFVYRVSFSLALFLLHLISVSDATCCVDDDSRGELQQKFFCCKGVALTVLNILVMFIPNSFFAGYAWLCMFVSAFFLVLQIMLLVDFSYQWNEKWGDLTEETGNPKWQYYLLFLAVVSYAGGVGFSIYNVLKFIPHNDCNLHGFIVSGNIIMAFAYTAVSVWVPHGSILPSGIVFCYTSFLCTTALRLSENEHCNPFADSGHQSMKLIVFSAFVTAAALAYTVVTCSDEESRNSISLPDSDGHDRRRGYTGHLPAYCYFYFVCLLGALYLAMLGTDWRISGGASTAPNGPGGSKAIAFWVKISTGWGVVGIYLWSLVAPYYCCRDRDFGYEIPAGW